MWFCSAIQKSVFWTPLFAIISAKRLSKIHLRMVISISANYIEYLNKGVIQDLTKNSLKQLTVLSKVSLS